jgi:hypothetical protein
MAKVVDWPLSPDNLAFSLIAGGAVGVLGCIPTCAIALCVEKDYRLLVVAACATSLTLVAGFGFYLWCGMVASV